MRIDPRLRTAITDVLSYAGLGTATAGGVAARKAGPLAEDALLKSAAGKSASTGTPITLLRGIAKDRATLAAVAGGAKSAGGGGMEGGLQILAQRGLQAQLAVYGITGGALVVAIGIRYAVLVNRDRKTQEQEQGHDPDAAEGSDPQQGTPLVAHGDQ